MLLMLMKLGLVGLNTYSLSQLRQYAGIEENILLVVGLTIAGITISFLVLSHYMQQMFDNTVRSLSIKQ